GCHFGFDGSRDRAGLRRRMDFSRSIARVAYKEIAVAAGVPPAKPNCRSRHGCLYSAPLSLESQFLFDRVHPREEFSQRADPDDLSLCFLNRSCGITEPYAAGHALGNAALRGDHAAISDFDVADDANLPRHRDALANAGAARDSSLRHDHRMFSDDHVVRNLHEIVDLHALLNPRPAKTRAINCGVRADLNIIVDLNNPELLNFFVLAIYHLKSETIRANHCTAVNDHTRPNAASLSNGHSRINETRRSDHRLLSDVTSCANDRVVAESYPGLDDRVRLDRNTLRKLCAWIAHSSWGNGRRAV